MVIEDASPPAAAEEPSHRTSIRKFLENFDKESSDEFRMLNFEFLEIRREQFNLQMDEDFRCSVGQKMAHIVRNRYRDILPYDNSRVILRTAPNNPDGYINASNISYPDAPVKYIAAQAPLSTTLGEFWTMVIENNISVVIMLCNCIENGMPKCEKYWEESEEDGEVFPGTKVYKVEEKSHDDFVYRKLQLKSKEEDRVVHHLHYTEWPDHGCPNGEKNFLEFVELYRQLHSEATTDDAPVLVHCSAGCGRTGSFIAFDIFRHLLESKKLVEINVKLLVDALRRQRVCMVQTPGQYQFLHKCIARYCKQYLEKEDKLSERTINCDESSSKQNGDDDGVMVVCGF